jgi:hypothetical protein
MPNYNLLFFARTDNVEAIKLSK